MGSGYVKYKRVAVLNGRLASPKCISGLLPWCTQREAAEEPPMPLEQTARRSYFGMCQRQHTAWGTSGEKPERVSQGCGLEEEEEEEGVPEQ